MRKNIALYGIGISVTLLLFLTACSSAPQEEIDAARAAVLEAAEQGADDYAPEELDQLQRDLDAAVEAVEEEEGSVFSNYEDARSLLAEVTSRAEQLKDSMPTRVEEAKQSAMAAIDAAKASIEDARQTLNLAPRGKASNAEIKAMTSTLEGLENSLPEIQEKFDSGAYLEVSEMAAGVEREASGIAEDIRQAVD